MHKFGADCKRVVTSNGVNVAADIVVGCGDNLKSKTPSVALFVNEREVLRVTWDDARRVCAAFEHVVDVAEYG